MFLPAAIGTLLLVNLLCAFIALGVGFAAGVWFFGAKLRTPVPKKPPRKPSPQAVEARRAAERAAMAASRVADLATNMASDVEDHTAKMKAISADLAGIDREAAGADTAVFAALDQMIAANGELQQRLEQAEKKLAAQAEEIRAHESDARTDSLTGIANRRAFDDELARRLSEWKRKQVPCTLLLLDIDFFKKFNDTHGHQAGDEVLRQVAKVLKAQCRDMDLPCRYGGEEFGVILPSTEAASACGVAERIRTAIEESTTVFGEKPLKVTCSIGLAQFRDPDDVAQIIRRADDGLYASKNAGRNCGYWNNGTENVPIATTAQAAPRTKSNSSDAAATDPWATEETTDSLGNSRPSFIQLLKRRVAESHRFGIPLSLLHLTIEDYEIVQQKYGNAIARQLVNAAESALEGALREMDLLSRLDRGEFVVMLPGKTQGDALQVVKRMRRAATRCVLPLVDRELRLRFRHGIAELQPNQTTQELLFHAAQEAKEAVPSQEAAEA